MELFNEKLLPDLTLAEVSSKELNPFAFDPDNYTNIDVMLNSEQFNDPKVNDHPLYIPANSGHIFDNGMMVADNMDDYLKEKGVSSSALKEILKTPYHYYYYVNKKKTGNEKIHFELGSFAHMAFLEPDKFDQYIIEPSCNLATKDGVLELIKFYENTNNTSPKLYGYYLDKKMPELKDYLQQLKTECKYNVIAREHQDVIDVLKENYYRYGNGIIPKIMKGAQKEISFYGKDALTNIPVRVRPDAFNTVENIGVNAIISVKTTSAQSISRFFTDTAKFQYELSEGMYQEVISNITGRKFDVTIMIMLQTVPPYLPAVFWWTPEDLTNGKYKYRVALDKLKRCIDLNQWPGFETAAGVENHGIINLRQPEWNYKILNPGDLEDLT